NLLARPQMANLAREFRRERGYQATGKGELRHPTAGSLHGHCVTSPERPSSSIRVRATVRIRNPSSRALRSRLRGEFRRRRIPTQPKIVAAYPLSKSPCSSPKDKGGSGARPTLCY